MGHRIIIFSRTNKCTVVRKTLSSMQANYPGDLAGWDKLANKNGVRSNFLAGGGRKFDLTPFLLRSGAGCR